MSDAATALREDDASRQRALAIDSFIVEAPAGAGKTELLTQRFLRLLGGVEEPEEIVALTFTNKAAGEMRARILDSLDMARRQDVPEAPHRRITFELASRALGRGRERNWHLDELADRLRVSTLDALCAGLARQLPLMSRFGAQPAVAEDAWRHYREAARRTVALLDDGEQGDNVALALAHLDNDLPRLVELLAAMLSKREQWHDIAVLAHPESAIGEALAELVVDELRRCASDLDATWQQGLMPFARFAAQQGGPEALGEWTTPLAATVDALLGWRAIADFLLTREGSPRKSADRRLGFPPDDAGRSMKAGFLALVAELGEGRLAALQAIRRLPAAETADEALLRALANVLKRAAAELWLVFREQGEVDFSELAMRAAEALGPATAPSDLALRLDYGIRHLLVDEFQDTSPAQIELLTRLTAGWQPGDGRTVFAVGDPMQSIYRFRKADVGLFLRVAEAGIGDVRLTRLRLQRNNRSAPAVVEWVNRAFQSMFPAVDEPLRGRVAYRKFAAGQDARADSGVTVHPVVIGTDASGGQAAAREADAVVALVLAERAVSPQREIAILVRARSHLAAIMAALSRHPSALRPTAVEIEPLAGSQVVQDVLALTRALLHRADRLNWLAVLRAPWCGLTLHDLHALAGDDQAATIWSLMNDEERVARLSADGAFRLRHVRRVVAEAIAGVGRQSQVRWIQDVWRKLGGDDLASADERVAATACFRRLAELEGRQRLRWDGLDEEMGALYAPAASDADPNLQLMTIHKSKGLEFDTVIVPGLHLATQDRERPLLAWDVFPFADGERLVAAPITSRAGHAGRHDGVPTAYDYLCQMERERNRNEDLRVLYVAATRAKRRLHLVGVATCDESGTLRPPADNTPLANLWDMVGGEFEGLAEAGAATGERSERGDRGSVPDAEFTPRLLRVATPTVPEAWWALSPPTGMAEVEETTDPLAAALGSLAHACLEQIVLAPGNWDAARIEERVSGFARWLGAAGWAPAVAAAGARRVAAWLVTTLASPQGQWVLRQRAQGGAEIALTKVGAGETAARTGVIDRTFVEDGVRWIIDYKTAELDDDSAAGLRAHAERYRRQLEGYAGLFPGEGLPVRIGIFYLAHGAFVEL